MPTYSPRNENESIPTENVRMNMQNAHNIVEFKEKEPSQANDLLGGEITDEIIEGKKAHKEMIKAVLKMKPKDIHILKKSAKYYLDNPDELHEEIDDEALEDLSKTINSNDLADMLESDFEMCDGGELDGHTLIENLARLFNEIPGIIKIVNV
jgi:hypothetical protein|tara:strand:- start:348 stop:806 length:459 start_codon:yes stop_codon:yes gene_type:complete